MTDLRARAWTAAATVCDPEIPVLTVADLGVLREIRVAGETVEVIITPTYSGCPAMNMIALDIETDRKSTRLNSSHLRLSRMPSSA